MSNPKVGDKIVITMVEGMEISPTLREVVDVDYPNALMEVDEPVGGESKYTSIIETHDWLYNDDWRYAVRKGDRLVVTRINDVEVEPTEVVASEDETVAGRVIKISQRVIGGDRFSKLLELECSGGADVWDFVEEVCGEEPIESICGSFNDVESEDFDKPYPQSYSEFNASSGGGKTLKDYTGVDITQESLAFKGSYEKALEGITIESIGFTASVEDNVEDEDDVNHPSHYNYGDIEVIDFIEQVTDSYEEGFDAYVVGNALKYLSRSPHKNGLEDVKKAVWYLNRLIERKESE